MNIKYPLNRYVITYDLSTQTFNLHDKDGVFVGKDKNGRELGRDAWRLGAEEVCFNYDLGLDERLPLIPLYEKYKKDLYSQF